jgi:uncharacterized protein
LSYLYFDTSALVKRYTQEVGSNWVTTTLDPVNGNSIYISEITLAECGAAFALKQRTGAITTQEQSFALNLFLAHCNNEYNLITVTRQIIDRAVILTQQRKLRGYDAVQLATALQLKDVFANLNITNFTFISADNNLLQAAQAEGLALDNPNLHP